MSETVSGQPQTTLVPEWTLGDRLRKVRRLGNLGQAEFAEMLGTNQKTYATWEVDKAAPRHKQLIEIAQRIEALSGIAASWVLGVVSPPPANDTLWERNPMGSSRCWTRTSESS